MKAFLMFPQACLCNDKNLIALDLEKLFVLFWNQILLFITYQTLCFQSGVQQCHRFFDYLLAVNMFPKPSLMYLQDIQSAKVRGNLRFKRTLFVSKRTYIGKHQMGRSNWKLVGFCVDFFNFQGSIGNLVGIFCSIFSHYFPSSGCSEKKFLDLC